MSSKAITQWGWSSANANISYGVSGLPVPNVEILLALSNVRLNDRCAVHKQRWHGERLQDAFDQMRLSTSHIARDQNARRGRSTNYHANGVDTTQQKRSSCPILQKGIPQEHRPFHRSPLWRGSATCRATPPFQLGRDNMKTNRRTKPPSCRSTLALHITARR